MTILHWKQLFWSKPIKNIVAPFGIAFRTFLFTRLKQKRSIICSTTNVENSVRIVILVNDRGIMVQDNSGLFRTVQDSLFLSGTLKVYTLFNYIHWLAKTWIYLTPYVCTEQIFNCRPFMHFKITLVEVGSSHLCAFFGTFCLQMGDMTIFKHYSKIHSASNYWPIWTQKVPKEE